ncbi:MAG TPA: hypothetical protein VKY59_01965 [Spirillospora sp.]|nr:hypothetical protein [Spirillospora sp.]
MSAYFERQIAAGENIAPWLILGPFYEDMSEQVIGLSLFEKPGTTVGRTAMNEIVEEAQGILQAAPQEGHRATFRGQSATWSLVRRPEKYLSWGTYNISNHLGAAFLTTRITPEAAGTRRFTFVHTLSERALIAVNGQVVWDNDGAPSKQVSRTWEYHFEAGLQAGENIITVALFRLARMAQVGCLLALDTPAQARVALSLPTGERAQIEESVRSVRLARDVFYPDHSISFTLGTGAGLVQAELIAPGNEKLIEINDVADGRAVIRAARVTQPGEVTLCKGSDLPDGAYQLRCTWLDGDGQPVTQTSYHLRKVTPVAPLPGYEHMAERKRMALEYFTGDTGGDRPIWGPVATYALGRYDEVDEGLIRKVCEFIAARKDCADFAIQGLLRLMVWEREQQRLSPQINALMKDTVLGFKYWVDEPGDTVMYMGSENHRLLFHVAEWMAGQLFPTEEFTNSRQRGLYHATKGRMYITEWLRQRGRFGFDEWHSNSYYPICIAPLLNVYDFAIMEDDKLRQMAGAVLDYMFFNLAADSYKGVFGTTHGRSYGINIKYPDFEGTTATSWVLFGHGALTGGGGMSPVSIATSSYTLPPIIAAIADDDQAVNESKIRQGILKTAERHANFIVYRTPDYLLSGLQDHRKGEFDAAIMVGQVTLANKAVIFWSCPHTSGEGSGLRPDYWSGHTTLPRVIQHRNVMALTWRLTRYAWMTHCFFEQARFDEVHFEGQWAFARVGKGYVGIYSQHGYEIGSEGQYAGRELQCTAPENTWLVECGREADWGSFDAFVQALIAAPVDAQDGALIYESPSVGRFVTGWDVTPTINGEPLVLRGYPLVESDWAYSRFGSGELVIRYGGEEYELWFNQ